MFKLDIKTYEVIKLSQLIERFTGMSRGLRKQNLMADNNSEQGKAQNHRVELVKK